MIGQRGWGGGDRLYSGFSSNRDDRGILGGGGVKFLFLRFFWVGKFWQVFFG